MPSLIVAVAITLDVVSPPVYAMPLLFATLEIT